MFARSCVTDSLLHMWAQQISFASIMQDSSAVSIYRQALRCEISLAAPFPETWPTLPVCVSCERLVTFAHLCGRYMVLLYDLFCLLDHSEKC